MFKKLAFALTLILVLVITACGPAATTVAPATQPSGVVPTTVPPVVAGPAVTELTILWAQWAPADYLQQIGALYEQETGIKVSVVQEPWGSFGDRFNVAMAAGGTEWDMVVGDSQWTGQGATAGYYVNLTDFMKTNGIDTSVTPATLQYYGEYPAGSKQYWAYPTEGDADGWAYRKDLFELPANMTAFKAQYGYDLAVPTTWAQLMDIAKFFTKPDKSMNGVAIYTQKDYDAITMGFENVMFSYGAKWQAADNTVEGVVNSQEAIDALQYYRDLYDCCQAPGLNNAFYTETNDAMIGGQVAMTMNYFAFLPALANPGSNPNYAASMGFFANPAGPTGKRAAALGGQGLSIISFVSPERQQAALDFIKWFAQESIQTQWAALGGYSCNSNVLKTDAFMNAAPYNPAFSETMTFVMDFWNIPTYAALLTPSQNHLSAFVVGGEGTAKETMDAIATEQTAALKADGVIP
ncbi:MAG: extracellular solute-binding protein [Chloroflexi bacterium]|nr:extracellular solute-binding protein [Chloroflexota bacterium]